ncbi:MAG TPA: signal peptidase I, partial [Promineifilum sp.]|nr:signal peptidase I [Promineifilum sp.]
MDSLSPDEAPSTQPAAPRRPTSAFIREIIETLLLTFFIFWVVNSLVGRYRIDGNSMNPTLLNGE